MWQRKNAPAAAEPNPAAPVLPVPSKTGRLWDEHVEEKKRGIEERLQEDEDALEGTVGGGKEEKTEDADSNQKMRSNERAEGNDANIPEDDMRRRRRRRKARAGLIRRMWWKEMFMKVEVKNLIQR